MSAGPSFSESGSHLNIHRRHLDESQRSIVAGKIATLESGRPNNSANLPSFPTQAQAAAMLNVSTRAVTTAREVLTKGVPEIVAAVERGEAAIDLAKTASSANR